MVVIRIDFFSWLACNEFIIEYSKDYNKNFISKKKKNFNSIPFSGLDKNRITIEIQLNDKI